MTAITRTSTSPRRNVAVSVCAISVGVVVGARHPAMSLILTPLPTRTDTSTTGDIAITDTATSDNGMALVSVSDIVGDAAAHAEPDHESDDDAGTTYARCADGNGTLSHLLFSDDDHDLARAKAICRPCGLKAACLSGALE